MLTFMYANVCMYVDFYLCLYVSAYIVYQCVFVYILAYKYVRM